MEEQPHWPPSEEIDEDLAFKEQVKELSPWEVEDRSIKPEIEVIEVQELDKTRGDKRKRDESEDIIETNDDVPSEPKRFQGNPEEEKKINFFKDRVADFKLFIQRRIPPDNETAQKYLEEFLQTSDKEFASELVSSVAKLQMVGGLTLIFGRMCAKAAMKEEDFVDRSLERPDLDTEKKKKDQLTIEIIDYHTQIKDLLKLAQDLPKSFWK